MHVSWFNGGETNVVSSEGRGWCFVDRCRIGDAGGVAVVGDACFLRNNNTVCGKDATCCLPPRTVRLLPTLSCQRNDV